MTNTDKNQVMVDSVRRDLMKRLVGLGAGANVWPGLSPLKAFAAMRGPAVPDQNAVQVSDHLYVLYARGGFPSKENQGFFANVGFVMTPKGVVVIDAGTSLQIGEMAIRAIKRMTDKPVLAVINTHYHGDHWLGNQAFKNAYPGIPIYAHPDCITSIRNVTGEQWLVQMMNATDGSIGGTVVTPPDTPVGHGKVLSFGGVDLKIHHYGQAHTPVDIMVEIVGDKAVHVGDVAMDKRIANIEDGSFTGTLKAFAALEKNAPDSIWVPAHGKPDRNLLAKNRELLGAIYENALNAVKKGHSIDEAKTNALKDLHITKYANDTVGFHENIGKFVSIAYVEAEQNAF